MSLPVLQTLLRDKLYRQSMDYSAPRDGQRSTEDGRPVSGQLDGSTKGDSKLTLMDLIAAHKAKSSTLAPSLHLTRQCAGHKGHKRILAMRANSGMSACCHTIIPFISQRGFLIIEGTVVSSNPLAAKICYCLRPHLLLS